MRYLVDECVSLRIVERLRAAHHDVRWIAEDQPGEADADILSDSTKDGRIVLTTDWDFGELVIRFGEPALGVVIVAVSQFRGDLDRMSESLIRRLEGLGDSLIGNLTIIEAGRTRQRELKDENRV